MKLNEQREQLAKNRAAAVARMETVFGAAEKEARTFTDQEQKEFDDAKGDVAGIDKQLLNIDDLIAAQALKATPIPANPAVPTAPAPIVLQRNLPKGTAFTRYVAAIALAKGNLSQALEISKRWHDSTPEVETVLRAAVAAGTTTDPAWAKPLVEYSQMTSEFIELLRPQTFIGRIEGFRRVPFNVRIPRQTAGSAVGWVGEGLSKPVGKLAFDSVTFPFAKVAGIVVITEELARFSSPSAEALVRQDLTDTIAQFLDTWFVSNNAAVAGVSPGGIYAGVTAIPVGAAGAITVADITTALGAAINAMTSAGIPMRSPYWLMHTSTAAKLGLLRTAQDVFAFRDEMASGKLLGIPYLASPNMPVNAVPDPDTTSIVLIEASEIMLAEDGPVTIDVSREASLQLDSAPATPPTPLVSLWQQNMLGIKAEVYRYWQRRRDAAVQLISPVQL